MSRKPSRYFVRQIIPDTTGEGCDDYEDTDVATLTHAEHLAGKVGCAIYERIGLVDETPSADRRLIPWALWDCEDKMIKDFD